MLLLSFTTIDLMAQKRVKFEIAKNYCEKLGFSKAIPYLEEYLTNNDDLEAKTLLAKCYKSINDYGNAEKWLKQVVGDSKNTDLEQVLYLAQILQTNEKYDEAKEKYQQYLNSYPNHLLAQNQLNACNNPSNFSDSLNYLINKVGFNSNGHDFGSCIYGNKLLYTSTTPKMDVKKINTDMYLNENFMDAFEVDIDTVDFNFSNTKSANYGLNTAYHEGPIWIAEDGKTIYFTRNNYNPNGGLKKLKWDDNRIVNLRIIKADFDGNNISNETVLPFNSDDYSCGHPTFDQTNQILYFVSDMPGGFGGTDLWYSKFENGGFSNPINMGNQINTEGNEMFPSIDKNRILNFASNGHPGLGGLDNFEVPLDDYENGSKIRNLGKPINTSYDDFAFYLHKNGNIGFLSSNRKDGEGKDDIYQFENNKYNLEILVVDKNTQLPIENADIVAKINNQIWSKFVSDKQGKSFTEVKGTQNYLFEADAVNYLPNYVEKTIETSKTNKTAFVKIELNPLVAHLLVIDSKTKQPISLAKAEIKPCSGNNFENTTNTLGSSYFDIIENCNLNLVVNARNYLPQSKKVTVDAINDTLEIVVELDKINDLPIVLNNIYYDFDESYIRTEAESDLNYLLNFLKENPEAKIELSSHTDSRGDDMYNQKLAQRRADAAKEWLVARGVNTTKIVAIGYGEQKPINNCTNDIQCSEEDHQRNRRTEFKVLNVDEIFYSIPKENIKVDKCNNCPF